MLIDFHVHCFPEHLANGALSKLAKASGIKPSTDGTAAGTAAKLEEWGVDKGVVLNIAVTPHSTAKVNDFAISCLEYERLIPFGSVHPDTPDFIYELDKLKDAGIRGVKFHPEYQGFDIADKRVYPLYEALLKRGFVMSFHAGWDVAYPDTMRASPEACRRVTDDLRAGDRIVLAHLGGLTEAEDVLKYLAGRDVYMDLALVTAHIDRQRTAEIIGLHPKNRLLFGTDCPWSNPKEILEYINGLNPDGELIEMVTYRNALSLLGL